MKNRFEKKIIFLQKSPILNAHYLIFKTEIKIRNNQTEFVKTEPNRNNFSLVMVFIFVNPKIEKPNRYSTIKSNKPNAHPYP